MTTTTGTTQKIYRYGRQSSTMDFEECNFRRHTTIAIPIYLPTAPYNLIVRAVLIFRASWEFSRNLTMCTRSLVFVKIVFYFILRLILFYFTFFIHFILRFLYIFCLSSAILAILVIPLCLAKLINDINFIYLVIREIVVSEYYVCIIFFEALKIIIIIWV